MVFHDGGVGLPAGVYHLHTVDIDDAAASGVLGEESGTQTRGVEGCGGAQRRRRQH